MSAPMNIEQAWVDAYNAVWQSFPSLDASNVDECRRLALSAVAPLIRAKAREEAWQPIETAPKNEEFLAQNKYGDLMRVKLFANPFRERGPDAPPPPVAVINERTGKWWCPANWLPLPSLPALASNGEKP